MNRKEAVLEAAIGLFAEKGFHATPTSEVARRAGVAEGTVFHHFRSKDEVLISIFEQMMDVYLDGIEKAVAETGSGLEALERVIRFHFRFSDERSKESLVLIRDFPFHLSAPGSPYREVVTSRVMRLNEFMTHAIERGKEDGSIRDIPAQEAVFMLRGMLNGLVRMKLLGPVKPPELVEQVIDFCRRGLANSNPRRMEDTPGAARIRDKRGHG